MVILDVLVGVGLFLTVVVLIFLFIAQKRRSRNEPVWGWRRRQYFAEMESGTVQTKKEASPTEKSEKKKQAKIDKTQESIQDLLELKAIEHGIIERERNEYLAVLSTDFVNFSLLQPEERKSILEGYKQLYSVINFPIQLLGQAVRQDFSKDRQRFEKNLSRCNIHAQNYNQDVLNHIQQTTEKDFRITLRIYYVVKYIYEPAKMAKLNKEQKAKHITDNIYLRADILRRALRRAKVDAEVLNSLEAAEALKRALNRDRMVINPMRDVEEKEKLAPFVTLDFTSMTDLVPELEKIVNNVEEALELVETV